MRASCVNGRCACASWACVLLWARSGPVGADRPVYFSLSLWSLKLPKGVAMVSSGLSPARALAQRLRELRTGGLAGKRITQRDLGQAIEVSSPSISSWESDDDPKLPPRGRLDGYATFFATDRSVAKTPFRVLSTSQLTEVERARRDELFQELTALWDEAKGHKPDLGAVGTVGHGHWHFPPDEDITIVCSALPDDYLKPIPYTDPQAPDYVELYKFADLDALLELFGHLRSANPNSEVRVRTSTELDADDYTSHLVLLGGVDWNPITAEVMRRLDVPVRQLGREDESKAGGFQVGRGTARRLFEPVLHSEGGREVLVEDVAHFFRAPSPLNERRTVTMCNGMYARGVYGAVRALTDRRFRNDNENYLYSRFADGKPFSIISRVKVILGKTVTPNWSGGEDVLHEWQAA